MAGTVTSPAATLTVTAGTVPPPMASTGTGSTLTSTSVTFTSGHISQDTEHWLYVGNSGDMGTGHIRTVSGLPTSGTFHVRWWSKNSSGWQSQDQTYTLLIFQRLQRLSEVFDFRKKVLQKRGIP
jgi:hypothetical protein